MADQRTRVDARTVLDPEAVRDWTRRAADALAARRDLLDTMNVFPVPDSDTGTNLWLTLHEGLTAVERLDPGADLDRTTRALIRGVVLGARGNSGVILGQYLAGLVQAVTTGDGWPEALDAAATAAYRAVGRPVEGTVLTVARAVATGARGAGPGASALEELERAVRYGYQALARTQDELPVLRAAGVCDAGAWGLLLVLGALVGTLGGDEPVAAEHTGTPCAGGAASTCSPEGRVAGGHAVTGGHEVAPGREITGDHGIDHHDTDHDTDGGEFEVMFVADDDAGDPGLGDRLRTLLGEVGGSVAVVGASGLWQTHVHTDDVPAALAVATAVGVPTRPALVRHLAAQAGVHGRHRPGLGLVAVTTVGVLVPDLARAGAVVVLVAPGQAVAGELARAIEDTGADDVLVLASAPLAERPADPARVEVRDGLTEVHLVAAAAALVIARDDQDVGSLLAAAVDRVRHVVVGGVGGTGDADRVLEAADGLLAGRPDAEVLTVVVGGDVLPDAVSSLVVGLEDAVGRRHPGVEVVVMRGAPGGDAVVGVE